MAPNLAPGEGAPPDSTIEAGLRGPTHPGRNFIAAAPTWEAMGVVLTLIMNAGPDTRRGNSDVTTIDRCRSRRSFTTGSEFDAVGKEWSAHTF
jgi:hypothetical protein